MLDPGVLEQTPMLIPLETSHSRALTQKPMSSYSFLHKRRFSVDVDEAEVGAFLATVDGVVVGVKDKSPECFGKQQWTKQY